MLLLALAGLVGVPYDPLMFLELLVLIFLMAFMICSLGLMLAARLKQVQTAMPMVQLIITPLMFLSGALFPLGNLPTWLTVPFPNCRSIAPGTGIATIPIRPRRSDTTYRRWR